MKSGVLAILAILTVSFLVIDSSASVAAETIKWYGYQEGMTRGKADNKKIFLNFHAEWCTYCTKMNKETFTNPAVIAYLNANFIPIKVDADREQTIAAKYKVKGLPSTWFLNSTGENIGSQPGFIPANNLIQILKYIHTDSYKTMAMKDFLKKNP